MCRKWARVALCGFDTGVDVELEWCTEFEECSDRTVVADDDLWYIMVVEKREFISVLGVALVENSVAVGRKSLFPRLVILM